MMADVKSLLKDARKLIDESKFKEAQECCKNILRKDKQNYLGLILLGKSLQDSDQAPLAFQKAIASKPDHPLAWQGLANHYEKQEDPAIKNKLLEVYDELLKLPVETDKAIEIITKLGKLGFVTKSKEAVRILVNYIDNIAHELKLKQTAVTTLIGMLKCGIPCLEDDIPSVLKTLQEVLILNPTEIELLYAKVILLKKDFSLAVKEVINLDFFPKNAAIRSFLCQCLCILYSETKSFDGVDVEGLFYEITKGIETTKAAGLLKSMILFRKRDYLEAYKTCVPFVNCHHPVWAEASFIIECAIMLKNWPVTQKWVMNFLTKVNDPVFSSALKRYLLLSLAKQQKWQQAINAVKDVPMSLLSTLDHVILAECKIRINEPADELIEKLRDTKYFTLIEALRLLQQDKYQETITLLEGNIVDDASCFFCLGKAFWGVKDYEKSQLNLLKAAKLNPEIGEVFLYLGHFYREKAKDLDKARKCYEKAYSLNTFDSEIAKNLSETYILMGSKDADYELMKKVIEHDPHTGEHWVYFRLGLHCLNKRDWESAIINFRNVIKKKHHDSTAFECLADAYFCRGSYTSALRAYQKVMTMDPNKALHCQTRIGYIHSLLTQYDDAVRVFLEVLSIKPDSILALKGIAETWMRIAKKKFTANMFGSARDCAQQAVNNITKAIVVQREYFCLWKIYADTLMFITQLPNKYAYVDVDHSFKSTEKELTKKNKTDIFPLAIACYARLAKEKQQSTSYDLASAYFAFYNESKNGVTCQVAFNLTIACIKQKPQIWRNWNLLGKICCSINKYNIAQHCFIKALQVTRKWSVAKIWCNLGTLYVLMKQYKLANYCFWRGQSTLPSYANSWIGQGLIAEVIREHEAMDLFRHASRLGYHPESALGYADWVCRTLKQHSAKDDPEFIYVIEALYAIPYAIDLVEWYSCFEPDSALACTILGILQERFGLLHGAFKSYEKALCNASDERKNIALLNMGRILVRLQRYEEAVKTYKAITEASFDSACGLALALFKNGLYEESYSAYDTALHWLSNEDKEKADLLVAMAGIMYMFKGPDDAKTLLFHSIQISQNKPTPYSLFAICSLGLLHSDQSLSKLALSELQMYEKDSTFAFDIGFLKSYSMLVCDDSSDMAIKSLSLSLHDHPDNAHLWFCMAQYCLKTTNIKARTASTCAQRSLCMARDMKTDCEPAVIMSTASVAEHLAGDKSNALKLAKKGLHMYPQQVEIWAALLFSLLAKNIHVERKDWFIAAIGHMRKNLEITRPLNKWVGFLEKKLRVM